MNHVQVSETITVNATGEHVSIIQQGHPMPVQVMLTRAEAIALMAALSEVTA